MIYKGETVLGAFIHYIYVFHSCLLTPRTLWDSNTELEHDQFPLTMFY
jgi:hypothetical protein